MPSTDVNAEYEWPLSQNETCISTVMIFLLTVLMDYYVCSQSPREIESISDNHIVGISLI